MKNTAKVIGFYCSSSSMGGLELNSVRYAKWFEENGWKVYYYCCKGTRLESLATHYDLNVRIVQKPKRFFNATAMQEMLRYLLRDKVRVVLFRDSRDMAFLTKLKGRRGSRLALVYLQAMQLGVPKKSFIHTIRYSRLDKWVATLSFLKEQALEMTRISPEKISVIPLGIELARFNKDVMTQQEARRLLDLPQDRPIAGVIGRIDVMKGQETAIKAIQLIRQTHPEFGLLILGEPTVGEGDKYLQLLQALIQEYDLHDHVFFRPFRQDVEAFYRSIDQFWLTSHSETFGTVTIEAMASRLPIIATNTGGSPELLNKGKYGILVPPKEPKALAASAKILLNNPEETHRMANRAITASVHFSHKRIIQRLEQLIKPLIRP